MKLLCCARCSEVFSLGQTYKECSGGHGGGRYVNEVAARIWGPKELILLLGFANSSFVSAARAQIANGDTQETFGYGGRVETKGRDFNAFIIPDSASSVRRFATKAEMDL